MKTLWRVKDQCEFGKIIFIVFEIFFFENDPIFGKNCSKKSPNGHNFPLTELKCKFLGMLERSFSLEKE
jgi:hypothetical protein